MHLSDFSYDLPPELIAQAPLAGRADARLLCLEAEGGCRDTRFSSFAEHLRPGDLLVFNNTRVIPARLFGHKTTGGRVEVLIERVLDAHRALAHIRASKSPKAGGLLALEGGVQARVLGREGALFELAFLSDSPVQALLERHGHMPLPPYITRSDAQTDRERYQTVYAQVPGAVAAPTAGLHFDEAVLAQIAARGIEQAFVTLHVGAGTFQPVRVEDVDSHVMHAERVEVSAQVCEQVQACRARGGRVVAVGTTSVRALEAAAASGEIAPFNADTRIFIRPGYRFRVVDALLTNFHLPESTLLMLVCAFAGYAPVMAAYRHAIASGYRFFSYGDAMFLQRALTPSAGPVTEADNGV